MKIIFIVIMVSLIAGTSQAADGLLRSLASGGDETVIETTYMQVAGLEEPLFVKPSQPRNIAQLSEIDSQAAAEAEFQGDLSVQNEIPYSYPSLSRKYLELRTLNEFEEEEAKGLNQ